MFTRIVLTGRTIAHVPQALAPAAGYAQKKWPPLSTAAKSREIAPGGTWRFLMCAYSEKSYRAPRRKYRGVWKLIGRL